LRELAEVLRRLPQIDRSRDPADNYLLAMVEAVEAEYLVTGDKRDLLALESHGPTRIVTARELLKVLIPS
jgi:predicted nucleic acid-binding protein